MNTFAEIEINKASLLRERADRVKEHADWLKACDAKLKAFAERTLLLSEGADLARIDRARKILQVRGDANEVVSDREGHGRTVRRDKIEAAKRCLAENPAWLKSQYFGVKNYASFGDQGSDCEYGMGPRHGTIVFSIGLTDEARKRDLTPDEIEDALYLLHILPSISKAEKAAA